MRRTDFSAYAVDHPAAHNIEESAMSITPQEALTRCIEHREIFHDEMLHLMRQIMQAQISPVMAAAIVRSLSVFNSLEANPDALARSGYRFGLRLLPIDSPELVRTEVGKVPLLVDRIDDRSPGPRRSA